MVAIACVQLLDLAASPRCVVDMDVGYKAGDQGSKHYSGFFLFHFILHSKVGLKLFFM